MTREEQKRMKEMNQYLEKKAKEECKKYHFKKYDYIFYMVKNDLFYSISFFLHQDNLRVDIAVKPLWVDDLLWDILDMCSNKKEPASLRGVGAFTIQSKIQIKNYRVENSAQIDEVVNHCFKEMIELVNHYTEENYLKDWVNISYQNQMIKTIVLIHNKEYRKALQFLKNTKINDFESNNKCFSDLAIRYIRKRQLLSFFQK